MSRGNDPDDRPGGRRKGDVSWNQAIIIGGLAMSLPGLLFAPPLIGYYLDMWLGTSPWLFIAFLVLALIGTAFDVYVILKRIGMLS